MSMKDMNYRRQRDLLFVSSHPSSLWTRNILRDLDLDSSSPLPSSKYACCSSQNISFNFCENIINMHACMSATI